MKCECECEIVAQIGRSFYSEGFVKEIINILTVKYSILNHEVVVSKLVKHLMSLIIFIIIC